MTSLSPFGANIPQIPNTTYNTASTAFNPGAYGAIGESLSSGNTLASTNTFSAAAGAQAVEYQKTTFSKNLTGNFITGGQQAETNPVWNFIVAPEDISWDTAVAANRVDIFGTNAPPVIVGTKGMRDLNLSNALIEGFTRSRTVEGRIHFLERLMRFTLNGQKGFVNVPVYKVFANTKEYGNANKEDGGFFVIKDVKIKETMRDFQGMATRATADIALIQVPAYQVDTGRDQASAAVNKATSMLGSRQGSVADQSAQSGTGKTTSKSGGAAVPAPAPAPKPKTPSTPSKQSSGQAPAQPQITPILF